MSGLTLVDRIESLWTANSPGNREKRAAILADVRELDSAVKRMLDAHNLTHVGISHQGECEQCAAHRNLWDALAKTGAIKGGDHG